MKKLYFFAALIAIATTASAQIQTERNKRFSNYLRGIPRDFTHNNEAYLHSPDEDEKIWSVYNDELEKVRSVEIPQIGNGIRSEYQQRKNIPLKYDESYEECFTYYYEDNTFATFEEALERMQEGFSSDLRVDGYRMYPSDTYYYYDYQTFGEIYPNLYYEWNPEDKKIYCYRASYRASYTGDWEVKDTYVYDYDWYSYVTYYDYDSNSFMDQYFKLTQTLFNTDDKFEYIRLDYDKNHVEITSEYDNDGDGEIDTRHVEYGCKFTGFSIVQEDGTVLQTITNGEIVPDGFDIVKINGKLYLAIYEYGNEVRGNYVRVFYSIDSKTNSIKRLDVEIPVSVHPAVTDRNGEVTVELGEQSDAQEILVVNTAGQTVKRIPLAKGQQKVVFSANGLNTGVNLINVSGKNAQVSRKIVVK